MLLAHFWWGSVFLINVPVALGAALLAWRLVPDSRNPDALRRDLAGVLLSVAAIGLVLWAVIEAPVDGWTSGLVIGPGAGGAALLATFVGWERTSSHPMLNLEFFRARSFSIAGGAVEVAPRRDHPRQVFAEPRRDRDRPVTGVGLRRPLHPPPVGLVAVAVDRHECGPDGNLMADEVDVP